MILLNPNHIFQCIVGATQSILMSNNIKNNLFSSQYSPIRYNEKKSTCKSYHRPWQKNLYSNEEYPDNYTDKSFLEELKKNLHVRKLTLYEAILGASLITQRLCVVILFALSFYTLNNNLASPLFLLIIFSTFNFIMYLVHYENYKTIPFWLFKSTIAFILSGYILSPVLKTLTETISTDTIYATTTFMLCIHLIFFDYGVSAVIVSTSLSLNAALFGSICLCSRLPSAFHVFVLISIAVQCFAVSPILLSPIKSSIKLLLFFVVVTFILCTRASQLISGLFVFTVVFINIVCPYFFIKWHSFKDNIYGPWDEAIVQSIKVKNI
ncbi:phosphatidylinositol N-acetylglucosaminyltransferase subunit C [Daktulosphaira vitifoliae]|uniref:phosphatidylinositol N-acetylglucosaminyltransferase subunit C n=1 Tax=Daktulosphaira vitifoliae TaxID=58002 RepID=UPI0021AA8319|nr:phosphatidylinositol N-acetylglucosaminyltransferase subunit C [Daktulosphaira vitifoliae]